MLDLGTIRLDAMEVAVDSGGGSSGSFLLEVVLQLPHAGQLQIMAEYFGEVRESDCRSCTPPFASAGCCRSQARHIVHYMIRCAYAFRRFTCIILVPGLTLHIHSKSSGHAERGGGGEGDLQY